MMNTAYLLDTETTADPENPQAIEVAWIGISDQRKTAHTLKPPHPVLPAGTVCHGVTNEEAQTFEAPAQWFERERETLIDLHGHWIIGHNIQYDIDVMDRLVKQLGPDKSFGPRTICTYRLAQKLFTREELGSLSLDSCHYHLYPEELENLRAQRHTHGALVDCELNIAVLAGMVRLCPVSAAKKTIETWTSEDWAELAAFAEKPMLLECFTFTKAKGEKFTSDIGLCRWILKQDWTKADRPDDYHSAWTAINAPHEFAIFEDPDDFELA